MALASMLLSRIEFAPGALEARKAKGLSIEQIESWIADAAGTRQ
jgi:hypothetical protein